MKYFIGELNTTQTRLRALNSVTPFMRDIQSRQGVYDFYVRCDETNNTPQRIDSNELTMDIAVKPSRLIDFVMLNFYAVVLGGIRRSVPITISDNRKRQRILRDPLLCVLNRLPVAELPIPTSFIHSYNKQGFIMDNSQTTYAPNFFSTPEEHLDYLITPKPINVRDTITPYSPSFVLKH